MRLLGAAALAVAVAFAFAFAVLLFTCFGLIRSCNSAGEDHPRVKLHGWLKALWCAY